jgi:pimeloyl-ACP methyl ester carboxylesterase
VNGLEMYYQIHGTGRPLVLLHGNLSTIEVDFARVLPSLARTRQVVAFEQQAHGHTADIDRPLSFGQMVDDTVAALRQLGIENADFFGGSSGSAVAPQIAIQHPDLVGKQVLASASYTRDGLHPGLLEGIENLQPEDLAGSPFEEAYARVAPNPEAWLTLIAKIKELDQGLNDWHWPPEAIQSIQAPTSADASGRATGRVRP